MRAQSLPLVIAACISGCAGADRLTTISDDLPLPPAGVPALSFTGSFVGGTPFGPTALPTSEFGGLYNGSLRVIWPKYLLKELAEIKARGGRVVLSLTGPEHYYKDKNGHFSLSRWKERVDEYRKVDFSSYIEDGTIIGHYLIDEPNDAYNWNGKPVPGAVVEEMAAYSKQFWPGMATIVRVDPGYLAEGNARYRHLDAAWAQYVTRKGTAQDYIRRNIADAQKLGLALVTGMNIKKGEKGGKPMTAALIQSAGLTILEESYPCAFLSWQYDEKLLRRSDVREAMERLASQARARASKSCHRANPEPPPPPVPGDDDDDADDEDDDGDDEEEENNQPPTAAFAAPTCTAGAPCQFTDASSDTDGAIAGREWSFGPGSTSSLVNPTNVFDSAGSYPVTLTVTDAEGATGSVTQTIAVESPSLPASRDIQLTLTTYAIDGRQHLRLNWTGASGALVDVYRNGVSMGSTGNDGYYVRAPQPRRTTAYEYRVCELGTEVCSNSVTATVTGSSIRLSVSGTSRSGRHEMALTWSGANGPAVEVYRNDVLVARTANDGRQTDVRPFRGSASYSYRVCDSGSDRCSNRVSLTVR